MKLNPMLIIFQMMLMLTGCVQLVTEDPVVDSSPPKVQPKVAPAAPSVVYSEPKPAASKKPSYTVIFDREPLAPERPSDGPQKAQLMDQEVAATGFGETIEAAKLDAVRNALSRSFDQFVFVERQIGVPRQLSSTPSD